MSTAEDYRAKAAELIDRAQHESDPVARAEHDKLALAYLRLADQAQKNAATDVVYETPPLQPDKK